MKKTCIKCDHISKDKRYCKKEHWDLNCLVRPISNQAEHCRDCSIGGKEN